MKLGRAIMKKGSEIRSWIRAVANRDRLESEMEAELSLHLDSLTRDLIRKGNTPENAARLARMMLGPALMFREQMRSSLGLRITDEMGADLRYALRMLRRSPGFAMIAAFSLALTIGANTTIFSIARELLYQRLAVPHAGDLRLLRWNGDGHEVVHGMWGDFDSARNSGTTSSVFSYPVYQQLRAHNQVLGDLFAFKEDTMNATIRGNAQNVDVVMVSGNYFISSQVQPMAGRLIGPTDDRATEPAMAVIGEGLWTREFARSPDAIGQTITLNQVSFVVVGVVAQEFTGLKGVMERPDVFVPIRFQPVLDPKGKIPLLADPDTWWVNIMARRKPGIDEKSAQAALQVELDAAVRSTMSVGAGESMPQVAVVDGSRGLHSADRAFRKPIYILFGLTGFVILLACANIANLLLARGAARQREMSVRFAVGAGRARILRQLLTESLLLAVIGGGLGLLLGYFGRNILPNLLTNAWERHDINTPFSRPVFAFTAGVTLLTGVLFGSAPALLASRAELSAVLKDHTGQATRRHGVTGRSIVAFQIALSTLLVIGAGLFARTLIALSSVRVGFNPDHLVLFEISPPALRYANGKDVMLHTQLAERITSLPGVDDATTASVPYIANALTNEHFLPEGETLEEDRRMNRPDAEDVNVVGYRFFKTMGIPIIAGRAFDKVDTGSSQKVAIINQSLATKRFPGINPIGHRFKIGDESGQWIQIIGICGDSRYTNLRDNPPAQFFLDIAQWPDAGTVVYELRTSMEPAMLAPSLRKVVQAVDPDLPVVNLRTEWEQINATMEMERAFAALTFGFGTLALALACVGVYGIMAYSVAQRTNEIGIRLALGAHPRRVRAMILRESTGLTLVGVFSGIAAAVLSTRLVGSMLYGVTPTDPGTLAAGSALLLTVALVATWIPANRAASIEPMEALRHD